MAVRARARLLLVDDSAPLAECTSPMKKFCMLVCLEPENELYESSVNSLLRLVNEPLSFLDDAPVVVRDDAASEFTILIRASFILRVFTNGNESFFIVGVFVLL